MQTSGYTQNCHHKIYQLQFLEINGQINPHQHFTLYGMYRVGVSLVGVSITLVKVVEPDAISICLTLL